MTTSLRLPGDDPDQLTVPQLLLRNVRDHGELPALSWQSEESGGTTLTWAEVRQEVAALAAGFAAAGVRRGEHVLLKLGNTPEHWLSDLALVHLGAVPVSVYGTAAPDQIAYIARHSRARLAVVGSAADVACWEPLLEPDAGTRLERLVVTEPSATGPHTHWSTLRRPAGQPASEEPGEEPADAVDAVDAAEFEESLRSVRADDPVTVVYTSGTTGDPKGAVITHRNVLCDALALDAVIPVPPHSDHLCYLPLAHIAERMLSIYLPIVRASHVHLCPDPARIADHVRELRPEEFFGVPRVWEKLTAALRAGLDALPPERRAALEEAGRVARAHVRCRERGERPSPQLADDFAKVQDEVIRPLLTLAGLDRLVWAASASAPLPPDVLDFWAGLGIVVMDVWGMTETSGALTLNTPDAFRLGSVGRPVAGSEVRIAPDGEIEVRGPLLFQGYLRADGSIESVTGPDGWFATGDVGRLDEDGFLWITDRKKEIIVTSTGKNVSPALVENVLKEHPLIGQAMAYGDGRSYLVALLVLDAEAAPAWAARHGIEAAPGQLAAHPEVRAEVDRAVEAANARLNRTEQIKRYRLLEDEWSPLTGELTPSMKLRRRVLVEKFGSRIAELYA